jgi:prepilin-type N-terminal cleavage/methylation domain-containing protein/prepilin-type processing-associated H-X9-DG protein
MSRRLRPGFSVRPGIAFNAGFAVRPGFTVRPGFAVRAGFTLVELLVVITIIGILAGLLFPAIQVMRNRARQTECLNNITQVGKGTLNFESSKQRFPAFKNLRPGFPNTNFNMNYVVGWVPPMLSFLGRADLYTAYTDPTKDWPPVDADGNRIRLNVLACPADTEAEINPEVQFVLNGGMMDKYDNAFLSPPLPTDYIENGISFNQTTPNPVKSSVSYVSSKDGAASTIMFAENEDADIKNSLGAEPGWDWAVKNADLTTALKEWNTKGYEYLNTVIWFNTAGKDPAPKVPLNKEVDDPSITPEHYARPLSAHGGGFNVVFCDGHARFVSDEIPYWLYKALMSADGQNARDAFAASPNTGVKGSAMTLDPVSDSQLDQ